MRVKMIKTECGPHGNFQPGAERDVMPEHGQRLVAAGAAVAIAELAVIAPQASATASPPEQATTVPAESRKKGRK